MGTGGLYDEQQLLAAFSAGDRAAFDEIYRYTYESLLYFSRRFLPLLQSEDVLADVYLKLWQHRAVFPGMGALHNWLRVSVRNAALNILEQEKRHREKHALLLLESESQFEAQYFRDAVETALHARILTEIDRLPPQQQRIIRMFYLEGMDNAAVAEVLQISVQAVKNQKVTALKTLRQVFQGTEVFYLAGLVFWNFLP